MKEKAEIECELAKVKGQKKSGEVRLGLIAERLAPFLEDFKHDPQTCTFIGQPIDYIVWGEKEITFLEVKSGKARLSKRQKHIKELVEQKKITWDEFRIN